MNEPSPEEQEKAKRYARLNYRLVPVNFIYSLTYFIALLAGGVSSWLAATAVRFAGPGLAGQALFFGQFAVLTTLALLPLSFYRGYLVEHGFGLSNQTVAGWLGDEAKSLAISTVVFIPVGLAAYRLLAVVKDFWWLYAAVLWTAFGFVLAYLAPVVIMPLFNKFEPLASEQLKNNILGLAKAAGIKIRDVLGTDMSKRTKKANAYFAGIGNTRRIVLGDTLLENFSDEEILTVVGHEMGHWRLGHLWKGTAADVFGALTGFYLADKLLGWGSAYFKLGSIDNIAGLPLILLAFMLLGLVGMPASNALSRHFERRADEFELKLIGKPDAAVSTFEKLARQNLADPSPHPLIEFLLYSHPPTAKRIEAARRFKTSST